MPKDMRGVMHEFKEGALHSGSKTGPTVTNRKQAIAIGLSEQRQQGKAVPPKKGAKKKVARDPQQQFAERASPGFGSIKRAPRPVHAPKTLAGRRAASHAKAYGA